MRRTQKTNLEFKARRLRGEIERLAGIICINLDCSLNKPEELPISDVDEQFDELKAKWGELIGAIEETRRLEEGLK
jgi:predicted transcriptional regulator YheO